MFSILYLITVHTNATILLAYSMHMDDPGFAHVS